MQEDQLKQKKSNLQCKLKDKKKDKNKDKDKSAEKELNSNDENDTLEALKKIFVQKKKKTD